MNCRWPFLSIVFCSFPTFYTAAATVSLVSENKPTPIFSGSPQKISTVWRNNASEPAEMDVEYVLTQASSATIAPVGRFAFRNLKAFPTQTFLESVQIQVPAVKAETRFLMRWQSAEGKVLGTTDLLAYPPSKFLLQQLKPLSGGEPLGVFDPAGELKQLLQNAGTEFADCQRQELANFTGKLLILGPFKSRDEMQGFTKKTVLNLAMKGTSIVWLQPPPDRHSELQPSFQKMQFGKGAVVLVQQDFLPDLAENPESQSRLLQLCTTAVCPREHDPFQLLHSNN